MLFFHSYKTPTPLVIDIVADIRKINDMSMKAPKAGMVILGGGVCKHQIANSMLFVSAHGREAQLNTVVVGLTEVRYARQRNGADFSVYINTGNEFDGSDGGARPDEAVSWGKIKIGAEAVKVRKRV